MMINTTRLLLRKQSPALRRYWVETADERCPLACVWFALGPADAGQSDKPDDSERTWPALLRGGQAFLSAVQLAA